MADILGDNGANTLTGTADPDHIYALGGDDTIHGLGGDDVIRGGGGDDILNGGDGVDLLLPDWGDDQLNGGAGIDRYYGYGTLTSTGAAAYVRVDLSLNQAFKYAVGTSILIGTDSLDGLEQVVGSNTGDDELRGDAGDNRLEGWGGDDLLEGGEGADTLFGDGRNSDPLLGLALVGDDIMRGGAGDDYLVASLGDDMVEGGDGIDRYYAYPIGRSLTDPIRLVVDLSQAQDQVLKYEVGSNLLVGTDDLSGIENVTGSNTGDDDITGDGAANALAGSGGDDVIRGGDGADLIHGDDVSHNPLAPAGEIGDDTLYGQGGDDIINASLGTDTVDGGAGFDRYTGYIAGPRDTDVMRFIIDLDHPAGNGRAQKYLSGVLQAIDTLISIESAMGSNLGDDRIYGSAGNNTLWGAGADDRLWGEDGADILLGEAGIDQLYGDAGADDLRGGSENDSLDGGAGDDTLAGGTGNDVYYVDSAGDMVVELSGEGHDIVRPTISYVLVANVESIQLQGAGAINATGDALANIMSGNSGANRMEGLGGVDTLDGAGGNDVMVGGLGNDLLTGGGGYDVFLVEDAQVNPAATLETDFIYDLDMPGGDRIDLRLVDADRWTVGDQAFQFVTAFSHVAGQATLAYVGSQGVTYLRLDVNGDAVVDYQIKVSGDVTATVTDILAGSEPVSDGGWLL